VRAPRLLPGHELFPRHHLLALALALSIAVVLGPVAAEAAPCANSGVPGTPYQGFGAQTPGGAGKSIYHVTTLADSGPGSLRDAVSAGNRCIVFDVAGDIVLRKQIWVNGAFVTVDGFTARSPGITLRDYGIAIWGTHGAHDVILRGLRFRNAGQRSCGAGDCWDAIQIKNSAQRVVIDHVSADHASDGAIDISSQVGTLTKDITIQWSILSGTSNQALVWRAARVSMHHNLFINGHNRNPQAGWDANPPDTVLDFRNNVVWNFSAYGTLILQRATANVVGNYYYASPTASHALVVRDARAHSADNYSGNGIDVDESGTEKAPFSAPSVTTTDACRAAHEVQDEAGARGVSFGLDSVDRGHLARMPATQLPGCGAGSVPGPPPPTTAPNPGARPDLVVTSLSLPLTLQRGQDFSIRFGVMNRGTVATAGSRLRIYLSTDNRLSAGDVLLRDRYIPPIVPGAVHSTGIGENVPPQVKPGSYYLLLVSDAAGTVGESNEGNNVRVTAVTVR
jgi:pectate lyase